MDLIGASELLISWPSTRTIRCHAERSSARSTRLRSDSTSSWCGRPSWRKVVPRTSQRPAPPGKMASSVRGVSPSRHAASPSASAPRPSSRSTGCPSSRSPLRFTSRSRRPRVEREHRDVDLLDDAAEQRRGLEGAQPLRAQRVAQHVHLEQRQAEPVVGARAARADRVVALAQRGEQVGDRLERTQHALAHERGADEPGARREEREGDLDPEGVVAGPEQPAR